MSINYQIKIQESDHVDIQVSTQFLDGKIIKSSTRHNLRRGDRSDF
jgi:hypothetical protein